jgi:hypothetical protein
VNGSLVLTISSYKKVFPLKRSFSKFLINRINPLTLKGLELGQTNKIRNIYLKIWELLDGKLIRSNDEGSEPGYVVEKKLGRPEHV